MGDSGLILATSVGFRISGPCRDAENRAIEVAEVGLHFVSMSVASSCLDSDAVGVF